ncbi:endonuclease/exonuclease/phosphatase family protein, partial [Streptomyces sp. IBSBF 2390]|uniref:endonuclease/exonuclease/phosphatase family protein n=1 Tax=Streptomyces sp. IBSBF 2390 TaxID=2903533 RepID=UPI002FDBE3BD
VTWNANGILTKLSAFEVILNSQNIDICLLTETHFTNEHKNVLKLKNYKVYSAIFPENTPRGGSSLIIKDTIDHFEFGKVETNEIQMTIVQINSLKQKLHVGAVYCSPSYRIKKESFKNLFLDAGERFILGGGFKAKHVDWG